ncbi:MAG TPA: hypothetical protein VI197_31240 [Polyangiaceae bacterium]
MKNSLLIAAVSGLVLGAALPAAASSTEGVQKDDSISLGKHACKGQNACKGQGGCKTDKHECKGHNACKGQGGCKG